MTAWPLTSATMLSKLRNTDNQSAWNQFAQIYRPAVYRFCRRLGLQDADADDVTQKVLEYVRQAFADRPPDLTRGKFRAWVAQVTRNATLNVFQRDHRQQGTGLSEVVEKLHQLAERLPDLEAIWRHEEQVVLLRVAAAEVQGGCTKTVWLAFEQTAIEGRSVDAVAAELHVSTGVVYASRSRVIRRIRNVVERLTAERHRRNEQNAISHHDRSHGEKES